MNEPDQPAKRRETTGYPLPGMIPNWPSSTEISPLAARGWQTGKIEPIMIKPRFSIWKENEAMAAAALVYGNFGHPATDSDRMHPGAGVRGASKLIERTLDPDSSLVSRCLRGD